MQIFAIKLPRGSGCFFCVDRKRRRQPRWTGNDLAQITHTKINYYRLDQNIRVNQPCPFDGWEPKAPKEQRKQLKIMHT